MKPPRIGSLRHRVVLEAETRTPDGGGDASLGWSPVADLWAAIEPVAGNESIVAESGAWPRLACPGDPQPTRRRPRHAVPVRGAALRHYGRARYRGTPSLPRLLMPRT